MDFANLAPATMVCLIFSGDNPVCYTMETGDVLTFLLSDNAFGPEVFEETDWLGWFNDLENWSNDSEDEPFQFSMAIGECCHLQMTFITEEIG